MEVAWGEAGRVGNGAGEANGFERSGWVVKFDERDNAGRVGLREGGVKRVVAAVARGACVEQGVRGDG